ncbi:saccharopine dehydrogenase family protein [Bacillus thuringiensis]|uniref:saccharopine dehydrogenase family protein n=1 Tax=Bacillus thuringiensis TaxID=1428 RepID=UPI00301AE9F9
MGIGAIHKLLRDDFFSTVFIYDIDHSKLHDAYLYCKNILKEEEFLKLKCIERNPLEGELSLNWFDDIDVIIATMPWEPTKNLIFRLLSLNSSLPIISITRPQYDDVLILKQKLETSNMSVILGAGLEPGLTEILAHYAVKNLDIVKELHIRCGGLPKNKDNLLGYKSVFGGKILPFGIRNAYQYKDGQLIALPRFSEVERFKFKHIDNLEVWNDGLLPWFPDHWKFKNLEICTQKTIRWAGYAGIIHILRDLGFLNEDPIVNTNKNILLSPKQMTEEILHPLVKFTDKDRDMVLFQVEAVGLKKEIPFKVKIEMLDEYDEVNNMTSMARMTGFTVAILSKLLVQLCSEIKGLIKVDSFITGDLTEYLLEELKREDITFEITESKKITYS